VGETLEFAFQCKTGGKILRQERQQYSRNSSTNDDAQTQKNKQQLDWMIQKAERDGLPRHIMLTILGLTEVEDTFVGDATVRGVSGGQRRRVTVGEMLMSRTPVVCGDEISTGLDAASTYDMIDVLFNLGRSNNFSRVFALLQPSPETVSLFDEVIVLAEGRIIYAGPIEEVEDYFAEIGFHSPEFVDVADFLQMVSTEDRADLYDPPKEEITTTPTTDNNYNHNHNTEEENAKNDKDIHRNIQNVHRPHFLTHVPTVPDLANIFQESYHGKRIQGLLEKQTVYGWEKIEKRSILGGKHRRKNSSGGELLKSASEVSTASPSVMSKFQPVKHKYANKWYRSTMLITRRFLLLWVRDKKVLAFSVVRNVINGASVGGVFINEDAFISIQGALFQTGIFILLGTFGRSVGRVPASPRLAWLCIASKLVFACWRIVPHSYSVPFIFRAYYML
jgi:ABC-type multidrug transport system ATPase subunit